MCFYFIYFFIHWMKSIFLSWALVISFPETNVNAMCSRLSHSCVSINIAISIKWPFLKLEPPVLGWGKVFTVLYCASMTLWPMPCEWELFMSAGRNSPQINSWTVLVFSCIKRVLLLLSQSTGMAFRPDDQQHHKLPLISSWYYLWYWALGTWTTLFLSVCVLPHNDHL